MRVAAMFALMSVSALCAALEPTPAPASARVYFLVPTDGAEVTSPVRVVMGLVGMGVAPAGVDRTGTGHHHLVINADTPAPGQPIPADDRHRHFGGGQTETEVELEPGRYTLQLVVGDHLHRPHEPPVVSGIISVTVR